MGVMINLVLTMSSGANSNPAVPAAVTAMASEAHGAGDDKTSRPPTEAELNGEEVVMNESPGSGKSKAAARKERMKAVLVDTRIEWIYVQLVPFQIPQAPSDSHNEAKVVMMAESECSFAGHTGFSRVSFRELLPLDRGLRRGENPSLNLGAVELK